MGCSPQHLTWSAEKAIDGNTNQNYEKDSCAITDVTVNKNSSIWWTVWLEQEFHVAYLQIYFRSDSKYV